MSNTLIFLILLKNVAARLMSRSLCHSMSGVQFFVNLNKFAFDPVVPVVERNVSVFTLFEKFRGTYLENEILIFFVVLHFKA